jgi:hypothetical protein
MRPLPFALAGLLVAPGPPKAMRLAPATVEAEMKAAGYRLVSADTDLLPRQYVLTFVPGA